MPKRNFAPGEVLTATNVNTYLTGTNNFLLNGGFNFWQRGTSFTSPGYTADRWYFSYGGTITVTRENSVIPANSTYCAKVTTGASSSFGELYQALESQVVNLIAGSTITVSAYVRGQASFSGNAVLAVQTNTTADTQTGGTWTEVASTEVAPTTTGFTRMSVSYAVPAGTKGLRVRLAMKTAQASGTGLYWGNVQLEEGFVATPFATAAPTLAGEFAACQRYYWRAISGTGQLVGNSMTYSSTAGYCTVRFPVTMRVAPTIEVSSGTNHFQFEQNGGGPLVSTLNLGTFFGVDSVGVGANNSVGFSGTAGHAGWLKSNSADSRLSFTAEL